MKPPIRLVIAGSRTLGYGELLLGLAAAAIKPEDICCVLSGGSKGIDKAGERWASEHGIDVELYPADWRRYSRGAPHRRNKEMVAHADAMLAVWDGQSIGTPGMIAEAEKLGLGVWLWRLPNDLEYVSSAKRP